VEAVSDTSGSPRTYLRGSYGDNQNGTLSRGGRNFWSVLKSDIMLETVSHCMGYQLAQQRKKVTKFPRQNGGGVYVWSPSSTLGSAS